MPAFLISVLTMLLLAGSCSSTSRAVQTSRALQTGPWSLELRTSGGFIGIGKGNLAVDSEGKCTYSETNRDQVHSSVSGTLYPRQFQPISEAVAQLDPKGWNKPGFDVAAPDAFIYRLEFRTGTDKKDVSTVRWYDNTAGELPEDLKRLDAVLEQTMKNRCASPP
jgi:hypothetical protein